MSTEPTPSPETKLPEKPVISSPPNRPEYRAEKKPKKQPQLIKEPLTFQLLIQNLLKEPLDVIYTLTKRDRLPWAALIFCILGAFALFGLILGGFSGGHQLWAAPLKMTGGLIFTAIITFPSLFIFSCLTGAKINLKITCLILCCAVCCIALLLLGFAPILWLFSTTSSSLAFFGFLSLVTWLACLAFGISFLFRALSHLGANNFFPISLWFVIFTLVSLQMPTTLRPIIGESTDTFVDFSEKKLFLAHWLESLEPKGKDQQ